jgi:general secretion pathway protein A
MYLNYYNLKKEPFEIAPDPEFLFLSPSHREALASIMYGVEQRKGFITITGEVGVGKTSVLRYYLEQVDKADLKAVYIFNPNLSFTGLLKTIFQKMGFDTKTEDPAEMLTNFHLILIDRYKQGRNMALIIDEAQNMP